MKNTSNLATFTHLDFADYAKTFDIRNLLLISLILGISVFFIVAPISNFLLIIACLTMLIYLKKYARSLVFLSITSIVFLVFFALQFLQQTLVKDLIGLSFIFALKFIPLFILASIITHDLPTSAVIDGLAKLYLPKPILLSLVVALRYVPTIRQEIGYILQNMKLRNIGLSFKNLLLHPLITIEYMLIPLLFRSLTIAEELAATAITRGIENPEARSCYFPTRFRSQDYVFLIFILSLVGFLIYWDNK